MINATGMARVAGKLELLINPDDALQSWKIERFREYVLVTANYRGGCTHSIKISTSEPEFVNASLD